MPRQLRHPVAAGSRFDSSHVQGKLYRDRYWNGASSLAHLRHNLTAVTEGPLPTDVLTAIDDAALKAKPKWPPYFYGV
jgi:hypothetical protein